MTDVPKSFKMRSTAACSCSARTSQSSRYLTGGLCAMLDGYVLCHVYGEAKISYFSCIYKNKRG